MRYFVADDRWGKRWLFTVYWMIRLDHAKGISRYRYPTEPGVWEKGKQDAVYGKAPKPHMLVHKFTRGERVILKPQLVDGAQAMREPNVAGSDPLAIWQRPDGQSVYLNADFQKRVLGCLPGDVTVVQNATKPESPVRFVYRGEVVGVVMPVRVFGREHLGKRAA